MSNLKNANKTRVINILNKKYIFDDNLVMSFKERIDKGYYLRSIVEDVPKFKYNRRKVFGMDDQEQQLYEEKQKETKTEYSLVYKKNNEITSKVSKIVYTYFNEWNMLDLIT